MSVSWIFQSNPKLFDIDNALIEAKENNLTFAWRVTQHKNEVMPGHIVYIWRSQGSGKFESISGIIAKGRITSFPKECNNPDWEIKYNRGNELGTRLRVDIEIDSIANKKQVIKKNWLEIDPIFSTHRIITSRRGTNFKLSFIETKRLAELYEKTGRPWTREESLAALWLYYQLLDKKISKSANSPVAQTALTIGRSVTGVYNKYMNFRYIDPTDPRKGLSGINEVDERVWNEFFDEQKIGFKAHQLEKQYLLLWEGGTVNPHDDEETYQNPPKRKKKSKSPKSVALTEEEKKPPQGSGRSGRTRNPGIGEDARKEANFNCEISGSHATFLKPNGNQYVEAHHLIPMEQFEEYAKKNQSIDRLYNIVSLCPNCHMKIHYGIKEDVDSLLDQLFQKRGKDLQKYYQCNIGILKGYYE